MKKIRIKETNRLIRNESYEGKSIERQLAEMKNGTQVEFHNKPEIYTERKHGVIPETDIRTDKMDMMMMAQDKLARARIAKETEFNKPKEAEKSTETQGGESIQA